MNRLAIRLWLALMVGASIMGGCVAPQYAHVYERPDYVPCGCELDADD